MLKFYDIACKVLSGDESNMIRIVPQYFLFNDDQVWDFFPRARDKTLASYLARGDKEREAELLKTTIDKATGQPKVLEAPSQEPERALRQGQD